MAKYPASIWKPVFLETLRQTCNVTSAARTAGINRVYAYTARARSKTFAAEWHEAIEEGIDMLALEARRRAVHGVEKPICYRGEVVGMTKKYSDILLIFLLKAHCPEMYQDDIKVDSGAISNLQRDIKLTINYVKADHRNSKFIK